MVRSIGFSQSYTDLLVHNLVCAISTVATYYQRVAFRLSFYANCNCPSAYQDRLIFELASSHLLSLEDCHLLLPNQPALVDDYVPNARKRNRFLNQCFYLHSFPRLSSPWQLYPSSLRYYAHAFQLAVFLDWHWHCLHFHFMSSFLLQTELMANIRQVEYGNCLHCSHLHLDQTQSLQCFPCE